MTEKEYLSQVDYLRSKIAENDLQGIEEELDELYHIKPVRLLWFVTKAELLWKQGKHKESGSYIEDKQTSCLLYPGIDCFIDFHQQLIEFYNLPIEARFFDTIYSKVLGQAKKNANIEEAFQKCIHAQAANEEFYLEQLLIEYFVDNQRIIQQMMTYQLIHSGYYENIDRNVWYFKETNFDYLEERLLSQDQEFIIVSDGVDQRECDVLISVLHYFQKKTFLLTGPVFVEGVHCLEESIEISLNNHVEFDDAMSFPCIQYEDKQGIKDNRSAMIQYLCEKMTKRNYAILLASGSIFLEFMKIPGFQKHVDCLCNMDEDSFQDKIYFGWTGDYTAYISDVYNMDVKKEIEEETNCDFSIVIPARNSAGTLEHTLKTCLNQDYQGSYEIIVSDNSTNGKREVAKLCKDLKNSRIKYYKTPRNLPLSKSFEFAYLKARGRFIFSIGSDDGVCSWTLSILERVLRDHPEDNVLQWQRGYYAWKGFNESDEGKLIIPGKYEKNNLKYEYVDNTEYFARLFKFTQYMYSMPMLYINSGCRRSYLKILLEKSGRLWDGSNQDVYMGIVNAAINQRILNISYPLTIAGMSNNSLGYISGLQQKDEKQEELMQSTCLGDNVGIYVAHGIVKEIPVGTGETCSLYSNLMRAIQIGVLPDVWRQEIFDFKKIFEEHFLEHTCLDDKFDKYLHYAH